MKDCVKNQIVFELHNSNLNLLQNIFIQQIDHLRRRPRSIYALMLLVLQTSFWAAIGRSGTRILVYSMWIVLSVTLHLKVNWIGWILLCCQAQTKNSPFGICPNWYVHIYDLMYFNVMPSSFKIILRWTYTGVSFHSGHRRHFYHWGPRVYTSIC